MLIYTLRRGSDTVQHNLVLDFNVLVNLHDQSPISPETCWMNYDGHHELLGLRRTRPDDKDSQDLSTSVLQPERCNIEFAAHLPSNTLPTNRPTARPTARSL